jgi:hypothetical protein
LTDKPKEHRIPAAIHHYRPSIDRYLNKSADNQLCPPSARRKSPSATLGQTRIATRLLGNSSDQLGSRPIFPCTPPVRRKSSSATTKFARANQASDQVCPSKPDRDQTYSSKSRIATPLPEQTSITSALTRVPDQIRPRSGPATQFRPKPDPAHSPTRPDPF